MTQDQSGLCRACRSELTKDRSVRIRSEQVDLYRCPACGLFEFIDPQWLDAAYADPIADIDVGLVARCGALATYTEAIVRAQGLGSRTLLDYGGGYGLLTRMLRDRGIDMLHYEPYAKNLFAQGLEGEPGGSYGCVTMVEVFEHLVDPLELVTSLSSHAELIVISTVLVPSGRTDLSDWWYLIPDLGQHITFYTVPALEAIARQTGYQLTTDGIGLHVFSKTKLRPLARLSVRSAKAAAVVAWALRRRDRPPSLIDADSAAAFASIVERAEAQPREQGAADPHTV